MAESKEFLGTGRRKTSVARVRVATGTGRVTVNNRAIENYFPVLSMRNDALRALELTQSLEKYDITVNVRGGGPTGQAGAVRHGISRALLEVDAELRPVLKADGLLTRDPRMKERKKYGQPGARKRYQFSKR